VQGFVFQQGRHDHTLQPCNNTAIVRFDSNSVCRARYWRTINNSTLRLASCFLLLEGPLAPRHHQHGAFDKQQQIDTLQTAGALSTIDESVASS